jgi:hypothetical protein
MTHSPYPSDKEGLCPSSGDINRLMMIPLTLDPRRGNTGISSFPPRRLRFTKITWLCRMLQRWQVVNPSLSDCNLSQRHNTTRDGTRKMLEYQESRSWISDNFLLSRRPKKRIVREVLFFKIMLTTTLTSETDYDHSDKSKFPKSKTCLIA